MQNFSRKQPCLLFGYRGGSPFRVHYLLFVQTKMSVKTKGKRKKRQTAKNEFVDFFFGERGTGVHVGKIELHHGHLKSWQELLTLVVCLLFKQLFESFKLLDKLREGHDLLQKKRRKEREKRKKRGRERQRESRGFAANPNTQKQKRKRKPKR